MELFDYDAELRSHQVHLRAAARVGMRDRVLDIGCGAGGTTREAARDAGEGEALGVDVSAVMVERARLVSAQEKVGNVGFEVGDAQAHPFAAGFFDLCISRFGVMFFADPVAAFRNIGRALRPGGRLVMMVWQGAERNEWVTVFPRKVVASMTEAGPGPFSLADPEVTEFVLTAAGFADIEFDEVRESVFLGADSAAAYHNLLLLNGFRASLDHLEPAEGERARTRLREVLAAHQTDGGVLFDSHAWIVTAKRPRP
ncbi:class I SAM-dependent methyltransferase [Nocardia caishijiensis]|uniref:Ubiquinone/menaquinone biosynthesis C-methylase UbiE n=1 Tax=Nocardia caishijiensis TaxID=184756 RepID=A0ABQ6YIS5_9NOCA|nr:class I SAM-dependent methyltransferase [Nocardia caishijiensis]KAF0845692.1 ubiquinone/menaquinone biosynthesis C-methylase UbiE [Nocardia caishijiensis]